MNHSLIRRSAAEGVGTAGLVLSAFGGGHFATKLGANSAEAAIIGTLAVVGTLVAVLHAIGPLTGGHVNPAVTIAAWADRGITRIEALAYVASQLMVAVVGAIMANLLWHVTTLAPGRGSVTTTSLVAECLAAGGLVGVILGTAKGGSGSRLPIVVPSFVLAASFAAPFGFANPAVAIAKALAGGGPGAGALMLLLVCEAGAAMVAVLVVGELYRNRDAVPAAPPAPAASGSPLGTRTLELVTPTLSAEAQHVLHDVTERLVRPTDLVVQHRDGRFLVLLDSAEDDAMASFERRVNDHLTVALMAAGQPSATVTVRPVETLVEAS